MVYYAVISGNREGIYNTWDEAKRNIRNYKKSKYRKFDTKEEAQSFIDDNKKSGDNQTSHGTHSFEEESINRNQLVCFTDGACSANGKSNAKASYAVVWPNIDTYNSAHKVPGSVQTNNRGEYHGFLHALKQADEINPTRDEILYIYTDSMLMINTFTKWIDKWKKNNWKKSDGEQVQNLDLVKEIDDLMSTRQTRMIHVRAHTNKQDWKSIYNDMVDKLACDALKM